MQSLQSILGVTWFLFAWLTLGSWFVRRSLHYMPDIPPRVEGVMVLRPIAGNDERQCRPASEHQPQTASRG